MFAWRGSLGYPVLSTKVSAKTCKLDRVLGLSARYLHIHGSYAPPLLPMAKSRVNALVDERQELEGLSTYDGALVGRRQTAPGVGTSVGHGKSKLGMEKKRVCVVFL